ncbi:unnamed protein product [Cylindrotheca closterium]|uniref:Peptidase A2 domain-containing protein n=1 Tax=Cylindrotheca closterium TaxID=2856 RepID=A0AAD2FGE7_9STRA|nr:unnamed protein product [Cylindrotheca closterium]
MRTTSHLLLSFLLTAAYSQLVTGFTPPGGALKTTTLSTTKQEPGSHLYSLSRRQVLDNVSTGAAVIAGSQLSPNNVHAAAAAAVTTTTTTKSNNNNNNQNLQADLPMIRLKLPKGGLGKDYVAVKVNIQGMGPFDFMVDSGLTTELITPHLQQTMGIGRTSKSNRKMTGYGAGGSSVQSLVDLDGMTLLDSDLVLPKLHALIVDFPQEHIDPAHDPVEGMLGMELLSQFDVDFDFPNNRIRFYKPGTAPTTGLVEIPAIVINETGLIGIRVTTTSSTTGTNQQQQQQQQQQQPILGFLDCGSTFSCVNWKAAAALGLPAKSDAIYQKAPKVTAIGVDGRPLQLPIVSKQLDFAGNAQVDKASGVTTGFDRPPSEWQPWDKVQLAVGDVPAFASALGDGRTPYQGPAALIGLDILGQRRFLLQAGTGNSRRRRVFVSPQ